MAPSVLQAYPTGSGSVVDPSPSFFRPSTIAAFTGVVIVALALISTLAVFVYKRRARTSSRTRSKAISSPAITHSVSLDDKASATSIISARPLLSRLFSRPQQPTSEPELPWPLLSAVPALRPKEPISHRMRKAIMSWKKDEIKHEPFTVADVTRAIEEVRAREQASQASPSSGRMQVPEIVVHSCDASLSYTPAFPSAFSSPVSAASEPSPRTPGSAFSPHSSFWDMPTAPQPVRTPLGKRLSFGGQGNTVGLGFVADRHPITKGPGISSECGAELGSPFSPASSMADHVSVLESLGSNDDRPRSAWGETYEERFAPAPTHFFPIA